MNKTHLNNRTRARWAALAALPLLAGAPAHAGGATRARIGQAPAPLVLSGPFDATAIVGPDRGLTLRGTLALSIARASGYTTGTLTRPDGPAVTVTGQVKGQLVGLYFALGGGRGIFGSGVIGYDPAGKRNVIGGTFTGPSERTLGSWDYGSGVKGPGGCIVGISVPEYRPGLGGYRCVVIE